MTIENHTLREELIANVSVDQIPYSNNRVGPDVTNVINALNYLFAALYPQYVGQFPTPANLPVTANANDYAYVINDGDGKSAAYIYVKLDNVNQWVKKYDADWSVDGLVQDVISQTFPLYVFSNGRPNGQTIYGGDSSTPGTNLEFNANAADNSGEIITHNHLTPKTDAAVDLGKLAAKFKDLFIAGAIKDGSVSVTLANLKAAYDHISVTTGNPHNVDYDSLSAKLGTLSLAGDAVGSVSLSSSGNKVITVGVLDDSHNHSKSTLPNFDADVYSKVKAILQPGGGITYATDDSAQIITPSQADITTAEIIDIDPPVAGKILGSTDGSKWSPVGIDVQLTGDVTGSGSYSIATQKISFNTTIASSGDIGAINGLDVTSILADVTAGSPTVVTRPGHKLETGYKIKFVTTKHNSVLPATSAVFTITKLTDDTFSIPLVTTTGGNAYYIPENAQFLYDANADSFVVRREFEEISHSEIDDLVLSDDHTQYVKNDGRYGGQTVIGGTNSSDSLVLQSTSAALKGRIKFSDTVEPTNDSSFTGSWSGTDLGSPTKRFNNLFMAGELKGARLENVTVNPASSGQNKGRVYYNTVEDKLYYDSGTSLKALSSANIPTKLESFSAEASRAVDMSLVLGSDKYTSDYSWMMMDSTTSEQIPAVITRTTSKALLVTLEVPITGAFLIKGI